MEWLNSIEINREEIKRNGSVPYKKNNTVNTSTDGISSQFWKRFMLQFPIKFKTKNTNKTNKEIRSIMFKGCNFSLHGYEEVENSRAKKTEVISLINFMGGTMVKKEYCMFPKFIVLPTTSLSEDSDFNFQNNENVATVTYAWLECCYDEFVIHHPQQNFLFLPRKKIDAIKEFENYIFACTGFTTIKKRQLCTIIMYLGGKFTHGFSTRNTHLICAKFTGDKYNAALKSNMFIIAEEWLYRVTETRDLNHPYVLEAIVNKGAYNRVQKRVPPPESIDPENSSRVKRTLPRAASSPHKLERFRIAKKPERTSLNREVSEIPNSTGDDETIDEIRVELAKPANKLSKSGLKQDVPKSNGSTEISGLVNEMQSIILDPSGKIKNLSRLKSKGDYLKGCTLFFSPRISHLIPEYGPLARLMGAKYVVNFEPEKCTHFIHSSRCKQEKFNDFLKAKENDVKIVSHAWIFECYQQGDHLDEAQFPHTTEFYRKTSSLLNFDGQVTAKTQTNLVVSQNNQSVNSNILNQDVNLEALPSSIENQNQNQIAINSDKAVEELGKEKNEVTGIVKLPPKVQDFIDNIEFHFKESHKKRAIFEAQEAREAEEERRRNMKANPIVEPVKVITKPIILEPLPPSQPIFYYNKEQELKKKELLDNMNRYYDKKEEAERKKREMEKEKENLKQIE